MKSENISTSELWQRFHARVASIVAELSPENDRVYWQESYENGNNMTGGIVEAWYDSSVMAKAIADGIPVVRSKGWYLDVQQPNNRYNIF